MKAIIVDDEPKARENLQILLQDFVEGVEQPSRRFATMVAGQDLFVSHGVCALGVHLS